MYEKFVQQIRFDGQRYEDHSLLLPDHFELCRKQVTSLLKRLRQTPQLLTEYNTVIRDQQDKGIIVLIV